MPRVQISKAESVPFFQPKADPNDSESGQGSVRLRHPGSDTELQLLEAKTPPFENVPVHAHMEDEIIYVLSGELHLGTEVLKAGDSIYVPGMALYSFKAGPEGLHFINFRRRRDRSYLSKKELGHIKRLDPDERAEYVDELIQSKGKQPGFD